MRSTVFALSVLIGAGALQACDEEDDPRAPRNLLDASQSGANAGGNLHDGGSFADAALLDAAAPGAGGDAGRSADASVSSGPDAAADASAASDAAASTPADAAQGYSPCPGGGAPCKILPLGDSITYGLGYAGSYRIELFNQATRDNKPITFVGSLQNGPTNLPSGQSFPRKNEGHSGYLISQVADQVPAPALNDPPHIVLLMAGTNDVNFNNDLPNAPKRLGELIDELIASDANRLVVVAQLTPIPSREGAMSPVTAFNAALPAVVAERSMAGKHVLLVDMHTGFPEGGFKDVVHPNQVGSDWMAGVWYQTIGPLLR